MDANRKPQMTRDMVMRLSGPRNGSIDGCKTYGMTGRSLNANRRTDADRRYVKSYRSSMAANNSANIRRFGSEMGVVTSATNTVTGSRNKGGQAANTAPSGGNSSVAGNSRQLFNAANSRPVFREPPARKYDPFG